MFFLGRRRSIRLSIHPYVDPHCGTIAFSIRMRSVRHPCYARRFPAAAVVLHRYPAGNLNVGSLCGLPYENLVGHPDFTAAINRSSVYLLDRILHVFSLQSVSKISVPSSTLLSSRDN